jgi:hypothetical protein
MSTAVIATTSTAETEGETAVGITILSTVAAHLTQTKPRQTNLAVLLAEIQLAIARQMRVSSRAQATVRPAGPATGVRAAQAVQIAVATDQVRAAWIQTGVGAEVVIAPEIEVDRRVRVVARRAARLAARRVAAAAPRLAVRGVLQV